MVSIPIYRSISIGGVTTDELVLRVKSGSHLGSTAQRMIFSSSFTILPTSEVVSLAIVSPALFGFKDLVPAGRWLNDDFLAAWSKRNLAGSVLRLCPPEVGPQLRFQFRSLLESNHLYIGMTPLYCRSRRGPHRPGIFHLGYEQKIGQWLRIFWLPLSSTQLMPISRMVLVIEPNLSGEPR